MTGRREGRCCAESDQFELSLAESVAVAFNHGEEATAIAFFCAVAVPAEHAGAAVVDEIDIILGESSLCFAAVASNHDVGVVEIKAILADIDDDLVFVRFGEVGDGVCEAFAPCPAV